MSEIADRLVAPSRRLSLDELAREWFAARISVRIGGYGALARDLDLLRRVRGGVGRVLMRGASAEALAGRPCPWRPPCALDILFREQGRDGPHGIPKPYVLAAEPHGRDLILSLTLFGFAADWAAAAAHALAETVHRGIDWRGQRPGLFLPRPTITALTVSGVEGIDVPPPRALADLVFVTPVNREGDDPLERPATLVARLARRVEGLARWHDATIAADWTMLARAWGAMAYDIGLLQRGAVRRRSGRAGRGFAAGVVVGTLRLDDIPGEVWPLLAIGATTHIGKGASEGFGRYLIA